MAAKAKSKTNNNEGSNFEQYAKSTVKTFLLMNKNHFRSSSFWLGNLLIPIMVVLTAGNLFPIYYSYIWIVFISLTFAGLASYGTLLYVIRKSTIKKNFDMTATESSALYSGMMMVMVEVMVITMTVVILSIFTFDSLGILSHHWSFEKDPVDNWIVWKEIDWLMVNHYMLMSAVTVFAIAFFFEQTLKTQKNFFIASFVYILYGMFFSGIMTNTIFIMPDGTAGVLQTGDWDSLGEGDFSNVNPNGIIGAYLVGGIPWFLGIIMPHYGLNQLASNTINQAMYNADGIINGYITSPTFFAYFGDHGVKWYWIWPLIQIWIMFLVGGMLARYDDK